MAVTHFVTHFTQVSRHFGVYCRKQKYSLGKTVMKMWSQMQKRASVQLLHGQMNLDLLFESEGVLKIFPQTNRDKGVCRTSTATLGLDNIHLLKYQCCARVSPGTREPDPWAKIFQNRTGTARISESVLELEPELPKALGQFQNLSFFWNESSHLKK